MHTEKEAKTKWCPFTRAVERWPDSGISVARNRVAHIVGDGDLDKVIRPFGCECIASECMAWRSTQETLPAWSNKPDVRPPIPDDGWEPYGDVEETTRGLPEAERRAGTKQYMQVFRKCLGYCGLAGRNDA